MNEIQNISTFEELKQNLNIELNKAAISFIRIGYLLKVARDTDILKDSEYTSVIDFAKHEYGLDASQVSRFMSINDRFAIGGYSEQLKIGYQEYGWSKLSLMLTLPDEINEELSPEMSKSDIQAIKEEYEEEQKTTPLERMAEDTSEVPDDFIAAVIKQLNDEHPEPSLILHESNDTDPAHIRDTYMPEGDKTYIVNIPGQGRFTIKCTEEKLLITSLADMTKSPLTWAEFADTVIEDIKTRDFTKKPEKQPEKKKKPKKVEKSKPKENNYVKEVREYHERENETTQPKEDIEKVEGEVMEEKRKYDRRELERIANNLRSLADQFERGGTAGDVYDNSNEELKGMRDEIISLQTELFDVINDVMKIRGLQYL
ncbi:MAG: hypothetical protein IJI23_00300 [Lachnospiraceae bacterium]|nr:hypothetical protein [Lachnospiraceae bacterium]